MILLQRTARHGNEPLIAVGGRTPFINSTWIQGKQAFVDLYGEHERDLSEHPEAGKVTHRLCVRACQPGLEQRSQERAHLGQQARREKRQAP